MYFTSLSDRRTGFNCIVYCVCLFIAKLRISASVQSARRGGLLIE